MVNRDLGIDTDRWSPWEKDCSVFGVSIPAGTFGISFRMTNGDRSTIYPWAVVDFDAAPTCAKDQTILNLDLSTAPTITPQPTNAPTPQPTNSPVQEPCIEYKKSRFLYNINKVDGENDYKAKSCNWLKKKGPNKIKKICRKIMCGGGVGVPRVMCPETCESCSGCKTNGKAKFFLTTENTRKDIAFIKTENTNLNAMKTCGWLGRQSKTTITRECQTEKSTICYGTAKEVCHKQCSLCS